jgi:hypothetical protein
MSFNKIISSLELKMSETKHFLILKKIMKKILIIALIFCAHVIHAQNKAGTTFDGSFKGDPNVCPKNLNLKTSADVENMITHILEKIGIRNRYIIMDCPQVENCQAILYDGKPYILYNAQFLNRVHRLNFTSADLPGADDNDWETLTILAHELGHHINNHLINPLPGATQIDMELEADETAGFIIYLLGGSLDQAQLAYHNKDITENGSYTHPPRKQRLDAVANGWNKASTNYVKPVLAKKDADLPKKDPDLPKKDNKVPASVPAYEGNLKKIKSYLESKQLDKAKTEIDAYLATSPADAEGYYMKAKIYQQIGASDQYKSLVTGDARQEAFDAFKKAMADPNDKKMMLTAIRDQYQPIFSLYTGYYESAADAFNAAGPAGDKAGFGNAMDLFIKANNVGQYIAANKWSKIPEIDTNLVLNIGKAALNAGKLDTTEIYFLKIADAGISSTADGGANNATFTVPYQWLTLHYKDARDEANMIKYANLGKKFFANEDYFDLVLIDYYRDKKDNPALFAKYEELIARRPDSLMYHFNYANDIFGYIYNGDAGVVVNNKEALLKTLGDQIGKAHTINPENVLTNWLYAQYYYNKGIDTRDLALKEDVKKKADLTATAKENFNKAVPYADKALSTLEATSKKSDKSRYKSIVDLMQRIYQSLNQNDKVKLYNDKYEAADSKFVN